MAKQKLIVKVFAFVIRFDSAPDGVPSGEPRLLVMRSDAVQGRFEVVRGKVEKSDPTLEYTGLRETYEEAGLNPDDLVYVTKIGQNFWQPPDRNDRVEEQHALLFRAPDGLPEQFDHVVVSDAGDNGRLFSYCWLPITPHLMHELAEGSDYFVSGLMAWYRDEQKS